MEESGIPGNSLTNFIPYCCMKCTSPWAGFELTTVVVRGTDGTSSCKSKYDTITTTTAPDVCYRRSVWLGRNKIIDHTMLNRIQLYAVISNLKMKINLYAERTPHMWNKWKWKNPENINKKYSLLWTSHNSWKCSFRGFRISLKPRNIMFNEKQHFRLALVINGIRPQPGLSPII